MPWSDECHAGVRAGGCPSRRRGRRRVTPTPLARGSRAPCAWGGVGERQVGDLLQLLELGRETEGADPADDVPGTGGDVAAKLGRDVGARTAEHGLDRPEG